VFSAKSAGFSCALFLFQSGHPMIQAFPITIGEAAIIVLLLVTLLKK